jgi:hypothetical protein
MKAAAKRAPRKPTVSAALKQAAKAGANVLRVEITADRIILVLGEAEPTEASNPWLVELQRKQQ